MDATELANKLIENPELKERVEQLIRIMENPDEETTLADVAEQQIIDELRKLGRDTLKSWATKQSLKSAQQLEKSVKTANKNIKKNRVSNRVKQTGCQVSTNDKSLTKFFH